MAYTTPRTWVTGELVTAALLNAHLRDNLNAALPVGVDAWPTWTPTLTNLTLGNGTVISKYMKVGRLVTWRFRFTLGTTSAVGTSPQWTLPVPVASDYSDSGQEIMGSAVFRDAGVAAYNGQVYIQNTAASRVNVSRIGGSGSADVNVTATAPFTWGSGDMITAMGHYEAAS